jgi:signal transduction histidine kinase
VIIGKLGIRGRLNVLLLLALAAVLLVATPFVVGQADNARSAGKTADIARHARELGGLIWQLQRERLLTAAFLASPNMGDTNLVLQQHVVDDAAEDVRTSLGPEASDELAAALVRLGSLRELRESALRRGIAPDSVARTYRAVISAIVDALRLVPQLTSDAEGTRQLTAIEALLRANEQSALRGMALIAAADDPLTGQVVLNDASAQALMLTERFVQQADTEHAALAVLIDQGEAARRVDALAAKLPQPRNARDTEAYVSDVLSSVESQANLRRVVQDQVTGQIADAAANRANNARFTAWLIGLAAAALFGLVAILAVAISRSISNPLQRLTDAAIRVADLAEAELVRVTDTEVAEEQVPRLESIDMSTRGEVGRLAAAFNRVQATAAMLVERQAITRRNVSLMFSNVAQRTQNLVGRQLALVDELERNEQDTRVLASLYRLDHLSTRLRRTADNLLVVAGTMGETRITQQSELANALRSALAEIEEYQRVRLRDISPVMLASTLGPDLVLVFAELLENATSFSPPESFVEVASTYLADGSCQVSIVDHGIGMQPEQLAEENGRLIERERLDIAPTSVLGLFVVGRLARRHSLTVALSHTQGGGITANVTIPAALYGHLRVPEPADEQATQQLRPIRAPRPVPAGTEPGSRPLRGAPAELKIPSTIGIERFAWFPPENTPPALPSSQPAAAPGDRPGHRDGARSDGRSGPPPSGNTARPSGNTVQPSGNTAQPSGNTALPAENTAQPSHSRLNRRVPGAQLPAAVGRSTPEPQPDHQQHDPAAVREALDDFQSAMTNATDLDTAAPPPPSWPGELSRRKPGESLAPGLRVRPAGGRHAQATVTKAMRDPDAERSTFDALTAGLAQAATRGARKPATTDPTREVKE